jgi:hypothetical protein
MTDDEREEIIVEVEWRARILCVLEGGWRESYICCVVEALAQRYHVQVAFTGSEFSAASCLHELHVKSRYFTLFIYH